MTNKFTKTADELPLTASEMQLMVGYPPPDDKRVTIDNFLLAPFNRWSLRHLREIVPTRSVPNGDSVAILNERPIDLSGLEVDFPDGRTVAVGPWLESSYSDGFIVLHKADVVYERYFNGQTPLTQHLMFSVTKSFTGTMALMLIEQGLIDFAPLKRMAKPDEIGRAIAYLADSENRFVTGAALPIDGGMSAGSGHCRKNGGSPRMICSLMSADSFSSLLSIPS